MTIPENYEHCEILVDGKWIPATFFAADCVWNDEGDEYYWVNYFDDYKGNTYPNDITKEGLLPEWRSLKT